MRLTPRQRASWLAHLFKATTRQHHLELRPLFAPYVPPDAVVIDVGAHAGQFSKLFAAMAHAGRVYAFEPSAYALSIIAPALRLNRVRNVTVIPCGLSDVERRQTLHTPVKRSSALGFGVAHLGDDHTAGDAVDQTINLTTLDAFASLRNLTRVDLIKADIEGWEMRALKGGARTLARFRPALYLEIDEGMMSRAGDTPTALFDWLQELGYEAFSTPELRAAPHWSGPGDYLFTTSTHP